MMGKTSLISGAFALLTILAAAARADEPKTTGAGQPKAKANAVVRLNAETVSGVRLISLQTAKAEITDVLRMVAEQGELNLVIGPNVKGEVSVYLDNVDVQTALKSITLNNGFVYQVDDDVISVSKPPEATENPEPPPLVTRVFVLRSVDAERVRKALEFALTKHGKMAVLNENSQERYGVQSLTSLGGTVGGQGSSGSTGGASTAGASQNYGGAAGMRVGPISAPDTAQSSNSRKLIVTDTKESVAQIAELVADLDKLPPQVLIEARIVEMTTELQRQLGIDWNINALANGPRLNHSWPLEHQAGFASGAEVMRTPSGAAKVTAGMSLGTIDFSQFTALLRANQSDNSIRLLANPRLLVYNNHSASILVGERYPILQATITDFGTVTEAFSEYIPVGVQLEVTPTIMTNGTISLLVHPATSALGEDVVGTTGLRVARIRTRELDTRAILKDGQTIVLGGLISDRKTHSANKVPGLGDVPILDIFFRQESPSSERVDLLIFLTAHVQAAVDINDRDRSVFEMYRPHFKQIQRLQDVPLHFEIPTEYEPPKPMFSEPPDSDDLDESPPTPKLAEPKIRLPRKGPKEEAPAPPAAPSGETGPRVGTKAVLSPAPILKLPRGVARHRRLRAKVSASSRGTAGNTRVADNAGHEVQNENE